MKVQEERNGNSDYAELTLARGAWDQKSPSNLLGTVNNNIIQSHSQALEIPP